jgi:hypothetical protein
MAPYLRIPSLIASWLVAIVGLANGQIRAPVLIAPGVGGFVPDTAVSIFGRSIAAPGDINGDGIPDLVVGSGHSEDPEGALWFLFLNRDGTVAESRRFRINVEGFGRNVVSLGDLDLDGNIDLATTTTRTVWLLFLDATGNVARHEFFAPNGTIGVGLAALGDINGDSVPDIAVETGGAPDGGSLEILYLNRDDPNEYQTSNRIWGLGRAGVPHNGFGAVTDRGDGLGDSIAGIGDLDGDGVPDLVTSAPKDDDMTQEAGALYLMFLRRQQGGLSDVVDRWTKILPVEGGVPDDGRFSHSFGTSLNSLGDLNNDGLPEIAVWSRHDGSEARDRGVIHILSLRHNGSVESAVNISAIEGNFLGELSDEDFFGLAVEAVGDLNGDGTSELAIGSPGSGIAGLGRGAVWIFDLNNLPPLVSSLEVDPLPARVGQDVVVTAQLMNLAGGAAASLLFRRGGDSGFFGSDMVETQSGSFTFPIPGFALNETGIEVFVETSNPATRSSARYPRNSAVTIPVHVDEGLNFSLPGADSYRLVSLPIILDDPAVEAALTNDLGEYLPSDWRLFYLQNGELLREMEPDDVINPGEAVWLGIREPTPLLNSGPGVSVETDKPFTIKLRRGWSLVGNPFAFEIPVSNVTTDLSLPLDIWSYDGEWERETEQVAPFSGYAIFMESSGTLQIDPDLTPSNILANQQKAESKEPRVQSKNRKNQLEVLFAQTPTGSLGTNVSISLGENSPNPFSATTRIMFETQTADRLNMTVYDVMGRTIAVLFDRTMRAGPHQVTWDGRTTRGEPASNGVYFIALRSSKQTVTHAVSLLR